MLAALLGVAAAGAVRAQTPANDLFAGRITVSGSTNTVTGSNLNATREAGEPAHLGHATGASVWWSWMAPDSGPATISTAGSSFDTTLSVYTGEAIGQLGLVAEDDDDNGEATSGVTFAAVAGTVYQIAVDAFGGAGGEVVLTVQLPVEPTAPELDLEPLNAVVIAGSVTNVSFSGHAHGTLPLAYQWQFKGSDLPGQTGPTLTVTNPVAANDGEYRLMVSNPAGSATSRPAVLTVLTTPADDTFAQRALIVGPTSTVRGQNITAGAEPGDPAPAGNPGGRSVWWTWVAPANGLVRLDTAGSDFDTLLSVYTGSNLASLMAVAENDNTPGGQTSAVEFRAQTGVAYQILVDGVKAASGAVAHGNIVLNLEQLPDNDFIENSRWITGLSVTVTDSNVGATRQPDEPVHGKNAAGHTLWWRWHAPESGPVTVDTAGSTFPALLAVYQGPGLGALNPVAHFDRGDAVGRVRFEGEAGSDYFIAVDGYLGAPVSAGALVLNLNQDPAGNDNFADRIPLLQATNRVTGSNLGATKEASEPEHAENPGGHSVWWSWVAPFDGPVTIATTNSDFDTLLEVYVGDRLDSLTRVAENDDFGQFPQSLVVFNAVAGTEYQIAVDGFADDAGNEVESGTIALSVLQAAPKLVADNDNFAARSPIVGQTNTLTASNRNATREVDEPNHAGSSGGRSLWWSWVAPSSEAVVLDTAGSSVDTALAVYTGASLTTMTLVDSDSGQAEPGRAEVIFRPEAGVEYLIAVDSLATDATGIGDLVLHLVQEPPGPQEINDAFANRIAIPEEVRQKRGFNIGAGREPGEPHHLGTPDGDSVWWSWVAPDFGPVTIDTVGSSFDTVLAVYTGLEVGALNLVADNDDLGPESNRSRVRFEAHAGTEYQIAVEGYAGRIGSIFLNVNFDAHDLPPAITQQPLGAARFQNGAGGGSNVTFRVVATGSLPLEYQWQRDGQDLPGENGPSLTLTNVTAASAGSYHVVVSNFQGSVTSAEAVLSVLPYAFNDHFANRIALTGRFHTVHGSVLGATKQPGETNHAHTLGGRSVWWTWTADTTGPVTIDTLDSDFDTLLAVYEGTDVTALMPVAANDDIVPGQNRGSYVIFNAVAGHQYQIAIDSAKALDPAGAYWLNLRQPPAAPIIRDGPANQTFVAGAGVTFAVEVSGVTPLFRYQWFHGSAPIPAATNRVLQLANPALSDRGTYHVVVSNDFGVATSRDAVLRPPQVIGEPRRLANGHFVFQFSDPDGALASDASAFQVQFAADPTVPDEGWSALAEPVVVTNGKFRVEDTTAGGNPLRCYRVLLK